MKISVVVASYNGEKYIREQLHSILDQTRKVDEVIISDDCSTDRTAEIVEKFIADHHLSDWLFALNEKNMGYADNYYNAMNKATGDLVFLSDQDDIWVKERVAVMASAMEKNLEIGLLNTDYVEFHNSGSEVESPHFLSGANPESIELNRKTLFLRYPGCVMCYRRSFYESVKEEWLKGWAHDEFLWDMALLYERCYHLNYCSLSRRVHENQTSGRLGHSKEKRLRYLAGMCQKCEVLICMAEKLGNAKGTLKLYEKERKVHQYRLELVRDRNLARLLPLLFTLGYYQSARSYPVEWIMALKGRK